ncbi:MAG: nuclear transport factor 2 family protein [Anaerolineales bacterium]
MSLTVPRQRFLNSASDSSGGGATAEISESSLRAADTEQMRIIVDADAEAQQEFMHPNYIINGPMNRVLSKNTVVEMLAHGKIGNDHFEREIEGIAITGNVGIVMGREVVHPTAASELGISHGDKLLKRRFTNVFLFEDGKWRFLARQASIVS